MNITMKTETTYTICLTSQEKEFLCAVIQNASYGSVDVKFFCKELFEELNPPKIPCNLEDLD